MIVLLLSLACASPTSGFAQIDEVGTLGLSDGGTMYLCGDAMNTSESRWLTEQEPGLWEAADGRWTLALDDRSYTLEDPEGERWEGELRSLDTGGVYNAVPDGCRSGAILADGQVYGTWCDGLGEFAQVEPVDPVVEVPESFVVHLATNTGKVFVMDRLP